MNRTMRASTWHAISRELHRFRLIFVSEAKDGARVFWRVAQAALSDRSLRGRHLRISFAQILATLALASVFAVLTNPDSGSRDIGVVRSEGDRITPAAPPPRTSATQAPPSVPARSGPDVHINVSGVRVDVDSGHHEKRERPGPGTLAAWILSLLIVSQTIVIALSRDYHDELSRKISLRVQVDPEDPERKPKVRLDWKWIKNKIWRRVRGFVAIVPGTIAFWTTGLWFSRSGIHDGVAGLFMGLHGLYWLCVFSTSKSARAWSRENDADAPWALRHLRIVTASSRLARWTGLSLFLSLWVRATKRLYSPASAFESRPIALGVLTIFRVVGTLPLLKPLCRPWFPVAVAILLTENRDATHDNSTATDT